MFTTGAVIILSGFMQFLTIFIVDQIDFSYITSTFESVVRKVVDLIMCFTQFL